MTNKNKTENVGRVGGKLNLGPGVGVVVELGLVFSFARRSEAGGKSRSRPAGRWDQILFLGSNLIVCVHTISCR